MNPLRYFDPIKWLDDFLCTVRNGGGTRIEWLGGLDGGDAERMLREHGVRVWGRLSTQRKSSYGQSARRANCCNSWNERRAHGQTFNLVTACYRVPNAFEDGDRYGLTVRKHQAKWAAGLLAGHGCAIMVGPRVRPVRPRYTWGAPAPAQGLGGAVVDALGGAPERRRGRNDRRERRNARHR